MRRANLRRQEKRLLILRIEPQDINRRAPIAEDLLRFAPINDLRSPPIFQHVLRIHPLRGLEIGTTDQENGCSGEHFIRPVRADDLGQTRRRPSASPRTIRHGKERSMNGSKSAVSAAESGTNS